MQSEPVCSVCRGSFTYSSVKEIDTVQIQCMVCNVFVNGRQDLEKHHRQLHCNEYFNCCHSCADLLTSGTGEITSRVIREESVSNDIPSSIYPESNFTQNKIPTIFGPHHQDTARSAPVTQETMQTVQAAERNGISPPDTIEMSNGETYMEEIQGLGTSSVYQRLPLAISQAFLEMRPTIMSTDKSLYADEGKAESGKEFIPDGVAQAENRSGTGAFGDWELTSCKAQKLTGNTVAKKKAAEYPPVDFRILDKKTNAQEHDIRSAGLQHLEQSCHGEAASSKEQDLIEFLLLVTGSHAESLLHPSTQFGGNPAEAQRTHCSLPTNADPNRSIPRARHRLPPRLSQRLPLGARKTKLSPAAATQNSTSSPAPVVKIPGRTHEHLDVVPRASDAMDSMGPIGLRKVNDYQHSPAIGTYDALGRVPEHRAADVHRDGNALLQDCLAEYLSRQRYSLGSVEPHCANTGPKEDKVVCRNSSTKVIEHLTFSETIQCTACEELFGDEASMRRHAIRSHPNGIGGNVLYCPQCLISLKNQVNLQRHIDICHPDGAAHACRLCSVRFRTRYSLTTHKRQIHPQHPTQLNSARDEFWTRSEHGTNTDDCQVAAGNSHYISKYNIGSASGIVLSRRHGSVVHEIDKTKSNAYAGPSVSTHLFLCPRCGYTARWKGNVRRHYLLKHVKAKPFECKRCGHKSGTKNGHRIHVASCIRSSRQKEKQ